MRARVGNSGIWTTMEATFFWKEPKTDSRMKVFYEEQRFNQWWIYLIFIMAIAGSGIGFYNQWIGVENEEGVVALSLAVIVTLLSAMLIFSIKLKTKIDDQGVHYQFVPFHSNFKLFSWKEIKTCHIRKYNPVLEYGGWGFRTGFLRNRGSAYNIKGNQGIQIELKTGKKILLGTQQSSLANQVISKYINQSEH